MDGIGALCYTLKCTAVKNVGEKHDLQAALICRPGKINIRLLKVAGTGQENMPAARAFLPFLHAHPEVPLLRQENGLPCLPQTEK